VDRNTAERRFARCSQLWDAARNRRTFRTHQQDQDADKAARRNRRKARVYTALADAGLICAVLAVAITFNHLTPRDRKSVV